MYFRFRQEVGAGEGTGGKLTALHTGGRGGKLLEGYVIEQMLRASS